MERDLSPRALADLFPVCADWYPWGTVFAQVDDDCARHQALRGSPPPERPFGGDHGLAVPCQEVFGIETTKVSVWSPHRERPVMWVLYDLAPDPRLLGAAGLAAMRTVFDAALDAGAPGTDVGRSATTGWPEWRAGSTRIQLSNSPQVLHYVGGSYSGRLRIEYDESALLAPYLAQKLHDRPEWATSTGEVEVVDVARLRPRPEHVEHDLAIQPDLYPTPAWVAERLVPERAAIWSHPAGVWGFGDAAISKVFASEATPSLVLVRVRSARGSGSASLPPLFSSPGAAGLDGLVKRLLARGQRVQVEHDEDS